MTEQENKEFKEEVRQLRRDMLYALFLKRCRECDIVPTEAKFKRYVDHFFEIEHF